MLNANDGCAPLSAAKIARMQQALDRTVPGPKIRGVPGPPEYVSQLTSIEWACVDQEAIIIYDPAILADQPGRQPTERPRQVPRLDYSIDPYYFRQASQRSAFDKLTSLGHRDGLPADREKLSSSVLGWAFATNNHGHVQPHNEITVRMAAPDEVKALTQPFSTCTTPLVFESLWMHNLNEWMSRGPVAFHKHQVQKEVLPKNLSIVLYSPMKIPVPKWNFEVLKPFSRYAPSSFADFSSRLPPSTPSNATAEGTHTRCFRRLLVWRDVREDRPYTAAHLGGALLAHHAPTLAALDVSEKPFWKSLAPSHMRVIIEKRATYSKTGTRQFLHLDELLDACNAAGTSWRRERPRAAAGSKVDHGAPPSSEGDEPDGGSGGAHWTSVECVPHAFGKHPLGIVHDMWVMRHVDVFVTFHGAGEMNAIFMPEHASLLEVRGLNASMSLADHWHPQISRGSGFKYLWWGLMVSDPSLVGKSGLDEEGYYADAERNWKSFMLRKRDQNVQLTWPHLQFMLERIARLDRDATRFKRLFGNHFDYYKNVVYEVVPGHRLPQRHPGTATPRGR